MKISSVRAELHIFNEEVNWKHPIRLQFLFEDGSTLRLRGTGDGDGLIVDRLALEAPLELDRYGRTDSFDFTERLDPSLRAAEVDTPIAIRQPGGRLVGSALPRPGAEAFCVWVDGDEFHWGEEAALHRHEWLEECAPSIGGPLLA